MQIENWNSSKAAEEVAQLIRTRIKPLLAELSTSQSSAALLQNPAYREIQPIVEEVLHSVQTAKSLVVSITPKSTMRVLAWNIERGKQFTGQLEAFRHHPYLAECDVLLLTETDVGMARSANVDVAQALAGALGFHYAFTPCYLSLVKGSGIERDVDGDNDLGLHGNAILSRYPLQNIQAIPLTNGIDKMASREQRIGRQAALSAEIEVQGQTVTVVCVHLDANSSQQHRAGQMKTILKTLPDHGPAIVGGDWNTTTFNSSTAFHAIMGFWLRVFMGPGNVIRNHYLHPYRRFERRLFELLEAAGFEYRDSNVLGEHTIYYHVEDLRAHKGLAEWVPGWCFPFIRWSLREHGGGCPLKIDWFATRGLSVRDPRVIHDLRERPAPLSDHDAIGVDVVFE
ncbi:MAG: endonuclease/exonuclease/phosphatase family protein [Acidobacteriia bacterium]|nr:endonuclease/exonuclease/phosphatase family protein [Terriglobia bacterium]